MPYSSEQALVEHFTGCLDSSATPWGEVQFALEFSHSSGRTDIIVLADEGMVIAFEAKLFKWREALHQAYRNTSFANYSYIILPKETANIAATYSAEFAQRKVGLCYIEEGRIVILHEAPRSEPIQPWLYQQAYITVSGVQCNASI